MTMFVPKAFKGNGCFIYFELYIILLVDYYKQMNIEQ
jgi:hypothetical protein